MISIVPIKKWLHTIRKRTKKYKVNDITWPESWLFFLKAE